MQRSCSTAAVCAPAVCPDRTGHRMGRDCRLLVARLPAPATIRILDLSDRTITDLVVLKAPESLDSPPRWSPDGTTIAFDILLAGDRDLAAGSLIATVPAAGGGDARITSFELFAAYPDWSPDGGRLAYNTYSLTSVQLPPNSAIRTVRPDGSDPRTVTPTASRLRLGEARWSSDGTELFGVAIVHGTSPRLTRINASTGTVTVLDIAGREPAPRADADAGFRSSQPDSSRLPGSQGDHPMLRSLKRLVLWRPASSCLRWHCRLGARCTARRPLRAAYESLRRIRCRCPTRCGRSAPTTSTGTRRSPTRTVTSRSSTRRARSTSSRVRRPTTGQVLLRLFQQLGSAPERRRRLRRPGDQPYAAGVVLPRIDVFPGNAERHDRRPVDPLGDHAGRVVGLGVSDAFGASVVLPGELPEPVHQGARLGALTRWPATSKVTDSVPALPASELLERHPASLEAG